MTQKEKAYFVNRLENIAASKIAAIPNPSSKTLEERLEGVDSITFTRDEILHNIGRLGYMYFKTAVESKIPKDSSVVQLEKERKQAVDRIQAEKARVQDTIMLGGDADALEALRNFEQF